MAEVVKKKVGLALGSSKNWGNCQGLLGSEGGAHSHPYLQLREYVYYTVLAQRFHDAIIVCLYGLHYRMFILVGGVEADEADYFGHREEERQAQIYGLSILGGQEITKRTDFLTY